MTNQTINNNSLNQIPLFKNLKPEILNDLQEKLETIKYNRGDRIIRQGEMGNYLYIIREGQAKVVADMDQSEEEIILSRLDKNDYFGEMALLTGEPRSASVIAESDIELLRLAKTDFDMLLMQDPSISLSMTHMLSQRLQQTDKKLQEVEQNYKRKIAPRGELGRITVIQLLKFAEENSFTGKIRLIHTNHMAEFEYVKGHLERINYENKEEDEAMDEILQWKEGEFIVEPKELEFPLTDDSNGHAMDHNKSFDTTQEAFEWYFQEKLSKLIRLAGARNIENLVKQSMAKFGPYFDISKHFRVLISPKLHIRINSEESWTDKHTLFAAVVMRNIINALQRDMVGMDFWRIHPEDERLDILLEEHMFFTYYDQAEDFIKG